ncbi:hypothetical protein IQ07DRAFT_683891 [Pyrenochaeta sp. DS3sAY3a]|nr:hypothetical protein IQ07DRAFT_683891 [Pyrenochaeta sp. DS3sAY3a]
MMPSNHRSSTLDSESAMQKCTSSILWVDDDAGPIYKPSNSKRYIKPVNIYLKIPEDLANPRKRKKSQPTLNNKFGLLAEPTPEPSREPSPEPEMGDKAKDTLNSATGNAPGGRGVGDVGDTIGAISKAPGVLGGDSKDGNKTKDADEGFGLDNKDVKGSLKVHIKLDLEADIRIIARVKGDIAIGLL